MHERRRCHALLATRLALLVQRHLQELHGGDPRYFHWILEREKDALGCALGGVELEDTLAVVENFPLGDFVVVTPGQDIGERGLAGAVRAHYGGDFAGPYGEVEDLDGLGGRGGDA